MGRMKEHLQDLHEEAKGKLEALTLGSLIDAFAETEKQDGEEMPQVREWIMDELERRDADAFGRWLDTEEASVEDLRAAFLCHVCAEPIAPDEPAIRSHLKRDRGARSHASHFKPEQVARAKRSGRYIEATGEKGEQGGS